MKTIALLFFLFATLFPLENQAQVRLTGQVYSNDGHPVPLVNIGVPYTKIWTVSRPDGTFDLLVPDTMLQDSLLISHVGYRARKLQVAALYSWLVHSPKIILTPTWVELQPVEILGKKLKYWLCGDSVSQTGIWLIYGDSINYWIKNLVHFQQPEIAQSDLVVFGVDGMGARPSEGQEVGRIIRIKKKKKGLINTAGFFISRNTYDSLLIGLRLYSVINDMPGKMLHQTPVVVPVVQPQTSVEVDLSPYNIWYEEDIFMSLEILYPLRVRPPDFAYTAGVFKEKKLFIREKGESRWKVVEGISPAYYLSILQ